VQLAVVGLHAAGRLEHVLHAFDAFHLHLVTSLQRLSLQLLQVDQSLLAFVDLELGALHVLLDLVDLGLQLFFADAAHFQLFLEPVDHGLLLFDHLGLGVGLLLLLGVEAVQHGLELVLVSTELLLTLGLFSGGFV